MDERSPTLATPKGNPTPMTPNKPDLHPLPASIYRNHAIFLLPRGDKWEVRTIYISPVCLAKVFSSEAEAFAYGKTRVDAENSY